MTMCKHLRCLSQTVQEVIEIFEAKEVPVPDQLLIMETCLQFVLVVYVIEIHFAISNWSFKTFLVSLALLLKTLRQDCQCVRMSTYEQAWLCPGRQLRPGK